ncbi:hypothetical protein Pla100_63130 [Neorhodopirellula pilleata]|uniref:Uncharacterized protein n=1 Tax=Neorhodopirellula pilleata TaxID=2714738 RepID=A0A5C5YRY3_9BACT|nr:hypothetical protein Pla100_63130 [Neorhodopirellula pilleata]
MRYKLLTLMTIVTICAILIAFLPRSDPFTAELQRDLNLSTTAQIWIIGKRRVDRVTAVSETDGTYKLFNAYRIPRPDSLSRWVISFNVLNVSHSEYSSKLPLSRRQNSKGPDTAQTYDHYPTAAEIRGFLAVHPLDPM